MSNRTLALIPFGILACSFAHAAYRLWEVM